MKFEGRVEIRAPRPTVWAFITDPDLIAGCGPGVDSVETLDDGRFKVHAKVGLGFISLKLVVNAEYTQLREPDRATVRASGQASGSAVDATARIVLTEGPDGSTVLYWTADIAMSGLIASVGELTIEGTARKVTGQTFDCIKAKLEA
jgi:carbon monoxide dehydrogenase subunit G